jgi:peptide/nickel transport system permease protein
VSGNRRFGTTVIALVLLAWVVSLASGYDVVADVDPKRMSLSPEADHWLGTDHLGRDVAWRLVTASQVFVGPGLFACVLALLLGVPAGAWAGWSGGMSAEVVRYLFTVIASLPRFVLVLLVCAIYGSSVWTLAAAAAVAYSPAIAEAVYARVAMFRIREFVLAAEAHGVHWARILGWHVLWVNGRLLIARHALQLFAYFLLIETTLSYIGALEAGAGFGVPEPNPSWGNMIAFEWGVRDGNVWATWAPALAIWIVILGALLLANGLAEAENS